MSSRQAIHSGLLCLLLFTAALPARAQDWGAFAERSGRADDPALVQALEEEDFSGRVLICAGIGRRDDPYAADVIDWLLARSAGEEKPRAEILLRVMLNGLLDPARGQERIRTTVEENAAALGSMIARIDTWTDPQLKAALVRVFPAMPPTDVLPALLTVGTDLEDLLRTAGGTTSPAQAGLALDYLAAVESMKARDCFEQCAAIARLSREKVVVDRARAVARELLAE